MHSLVRAPVVGAWVQSLEGPVMPSEEVLAWSPRVFRLDWGSGLVASPFVPAPGAQQWSWMGGSRGQGAWTGGSGEQGGWVKLQTAEAFHVT